MELPGPWVAAEANDDIRRNGIGLDPVGAEWSEIDVPGHWQQHAKFASSDGPVLYRTNFHAPAPAEGHRRWVTFDGVLYQGDVWLDGAYLGDPEGYFTLVGRLKRFAKLFGRRVSLEDVERELESAFPVRAIATDANERLGLYVAADETVGDEAMLIHLSRFLAVPPAAIVMRRVAELPLTSTGKKDYRWAEARR